MDITKKEKFLHNNRIRRFCRKMAKALYPKFDKTVIKGKTIIVGSMGMTKDGIFETYLTPPENYIPLKEIWDAKPNYSEPIKGKLLYKIPFQQIVVDEYNHAWEYYFTSEGVKYKFLYSLIKE